MLNSKICKTISIFLIILLLSMNISLITSSSTISDITLPHPKNVDMSLECAMSRRMSIRNFTEEPITLENLSTILWAAYGLRDDGNLTVPAFNGKHAVSIYILREEAVYKYIPKDHLLKFFKKGDYRNVVGWQYEAPIQIGLAWNKTNNPDENISAAEIGAVGQNIQFMAVALKLGTVVTGERPSPLDAVDLPNCEEGKIVMPIGHPRYPYNFKYRPMWISLLPKMQTSDMNLTNALNQRVESKEFTGKLDRREKSQILWSTYGYSYMIDRSNQDKNPLKRHRTVPSAHGFYPIRVYTVSKSGIYRYHPSLFDIDRIGLPIISFLTPVRIGDYRKIIAEASDPMVEDAPMSIIIVLNIKKTNQWDDLSLPFIRWVWFYEAGACAHNIMLETAAWDLKSNITPIDSDNTVLYLLKLTEKNFQPMLIIPVGK